MHLLKTFIAISLLASIAPLQAEQPPNGAEGSHVKFSNAEMSKGIEIFQYHCARCHGKTAEGDGRFAVIYRRLHSSLPSNFTMGYFETRPSEYLKSIISGGGEANRRSKYMPPFKDALSSKEIDMLVMLIQKTGANRKFPTKDNP